MESSGYEPGGDHLHLHPGYDSKDVHDDHSDHRYHIHHILHIVYEQGGDHLHMKIHKTKLAHF